MKPIRVLVVDDSASMRGLICATLSRDPAISVVGQAADPIQAREAIKALNPDVVTLDCLLDRLVDGDAAPAEGLSSFCLRVDACDHRDPLHLAEHAQVNRAHIPEPHDQARESLGVSRRHLPPR